MRFVSIFVLLVAVSQASDLHQCDFSKEIITECQTNALVVKTAEFAETAECKEKWESITDHRIKLKVC